MAVTKISVQQLSDKLFKLVGKNYLFVNKENITLDLKENTLAINKLLNADLSVPTAEEVKYASIAFVRDASTNAIISIAKIVSYDETAGTIIAVADRASTDVLADLEKHIADVENPHKVTAAQVGLGNVDNTSDIDKPVSTAQQEAIDKEAAAREEADNQLAADLDKEKTDRLTGDINTLARVTEVRKELKEMIETNSANIEAEATARQEADAKLTEDLDKEKTERLAGDINTLARVTEVRKELKEMIETNSADIATNRADIDKNAENIATNKANIEVNAANIASNLEKIDKNAEDIATLNDRAVQYDDYDNVYFRKDVVIGNNQKLLGTAPNGSTHVLAATLSWDVGTEKEFTQNEFGSMKVHANLNSVDRPTVETPDGKFNIGYKEELDSVKAELDSTIDVVKADIATNKSNIEANKAAIESNDADIATINTTLDEHKVLIDERVTKAEAQTFVKDVTYNNETCIFTFTLYNNSKIEIDLPLEMTVKDGRYEEATKELVLVLLSGVEVRIPVIDLVDIYTGTENDQLQVTVSKGNVIEAILKADSIDESFLTPAVRERLATIEANIKTNADNIASNDADILALQEKDAALDVEIQSLKDKDASIDTEIQGLKDKDVALETSITNLDKKVDENVATLDAKIDTTKSELDTKIDENVATLNSKIDTSVATLDAKIDTTKVELDTKITAVDTKLDNTKVELDTKIDTSVATLNEKIDTSVETLNKRIDDTTADLQSQVDKNVADIATNKASIEKNAEDIATNKANIEANAVNIGVNETNIGVNAEAIEALDVRVTANEEDIATNASNIATNKEAIETNAATIEVNRTNIRTNTRNIETNIANIATNTADIATNKEAIAKNTTDIETNKTNIAKNTADIAKNSTNIAQNTADIRTNAAAILDNKNNIIQNAGNISDNSLAISEVARDVAANTVAIENFRKEINNKEHFKGYYATNQEIQLLQGYAGDYAYSAESGTKWSFNTTTSTWVDTGIVIPDQVIPKTTTVPLMNGEAAVGEETNYAAGDHVHPHDTTKADVVDLDAHKADYNNPHQVTKAQVGLDQVDNTSDVNKPVSLAQQAAIDAEATARQEADTKLQENLDAEKQQRLADDINTLARVTEVRKELKEMIETNADAIAINKTSIEANATAIAENKAAIESNDADIVSLQTSIAKNTADITTNAVAIENIKETVRLDNAKLDTAVENIETNRLAIEANKTQIDKNTEDILRIDEVNTRQITEIANNKTAIEANAKSIADNKAEIDVLRTNIEQNSEDIELNAKAIAQNITDIETLEASVETNRTAIEALKVKDTEVDTSIANLDTKVAQNTTDIATNKTAIDERVTKTEAQTFIKDVAFDSTNFTLTFTAYDNSTETFDLPLESTVKDGHYDADTQELVLVLVSDTEIRIPADHLIDIYTGKDNTQIKVTVDTDKVIEAILQADSIDETFLTSALRTRLDAIETNTTDITDLKAKDTALETELNTLETNVTTNSADIATNKADIATNKASIETINTTLETKQDKEDNTLETTDKTVVGAINEIKTRLDTLSYIEELDLTDLIDGATQTFTIPAGIEIKETSYINLFYNGYRMYRKTDYTKTIVDGKVTEITTILDNAPVVGDTLVLEYFV